MTNRHAATLLTLTVLTAASGAQCGRRDYSQMAAYGPRVLTQNPTLGDVVQVVNDNSAKIRTLYTTKATLSVPDAPSLNASLAMERPKRLRLRGDTTITGTELDVGSNDERFWFWIRRAPPPTVYFCRHDQFETSAAKQFVPIDPQWVIDAVCAASFDPAMQHSQPVRNTNGRLEIQTTIPSSTGNLTKTTVVDDSRGWVLEQHLYDARGALVASAITGRHWRDPASGAIVPQEIEIRGAGNQFSLKFDVREWVVNSLPVTDPTQLFTMPTVPGWNVVDLGDPNLRMGPTPGMPQPQVGSTPMTTPVPTPVPGLNPNASARLSTMSNPATSWSGPTSSSPMGPMFSPPGNSGGRPATSPALVQPGATPPTYGRY